ncbi:MAG: YebC/PmpR family DNA-binding transcriptional regulator [Candidatus Magnetobacterium sp. LHC-1]|uniref:Probable transcriptional regulatory protein HWQ67_06565 n=1 Tax=Candidatus Magnetobacterium casense TaxID=1455061 RepID=A0ABS6RYY5_9BACT|nr:YebC/PmpR family DNA-binding transcriptional regulator [Candidatus Magnetobacterium casensis]MBF0608276.1 YebC/PmpR family DNA-binding transcriptional regulator [Nitrospirota bacterium]MBV6341244.1 YebC/PmpR family DNA-binding transcriptional regulator [Candidatus Magnetobacterium casensis]
MAGHSKWAQIKRKKATTDSKRGKVFSKIVKEISIAARMGGPDPDGNARLRTAVEKAKMANMPVDNVKRAIQKGAGELSGQNYEDIIYEGYGPGGVAILMEVLTDNKNMVVGEVRHILTKNGGTLGEAGCVAWMFKKRGYIEVEKKLISEDSLLGIVLDAGVDDVKNDPKEEHYGVITAIEDFAQVRTALEQARIKIASGEITMIPNTYINVDTATLQQNMKIIDALEDLDDVQNVYANFELPDDMMTDA